MPEPILIAGVEDFAAVLRLARGMHHRSAIAAAAGHDDRTARRHETGEACSPRTLIDLLDACGWRMEVRLVPADTPGRRRLAASTTPTVPTYDRVLAYVEAHPGTTADDVATHIRMSGGYARRLLRQGIRAGEVWLMSGAGACDPGRYWLAEQTPPHDE